MLGRNLLSLSRGRIGGDVERHSRCKSVEAALPLKRWAASGVFKVAFVRTRLDAEFRPDAPTSRALAWLTCARACGVCT